MSSPVRPSRSHRWYQRRLAALRVGLLEPSEEGLLREHLEECHDCREAYEAAGFGPEHEPLGDHIPPDLLARWGRARNALRGLERAMVREHLARCPDCRQELELLGHVPELEHVPSLELAAGALGTAPDLERFAESQATTAERADAEGGRKRRAGARSRSAEAGRPTAGEARGRVAWIHWALGGWAAAATATAALLIAVRAPSPGGDGMPRPGATVTSPAPAAPGPQVEAERQPGSAVTMPPALESAAVVVLERTWRGTPAGDTLVLNEVRPETRTFVVGIPTEAMVDVPPESRVRIELLAPSGRVVSSADFALRQLLAERALVLRLEDKISSGTYRLRLTARRHEPIEAPFRVRVIEDR